MVEYYDAVLHAVTEGLLLTDLDGRLRLANDEAVRLLGPARRRPRPTRRRARAVRTARGRTDRRRASRGRAARDVGRGCWCSTRPGRSGRAGRSGSSRRCATAPTSSTSPVSSTRRAASPRRCARRPTSRRTGCTPSCRSSSSATPSGRWPSPPTSSQVSQRLTDRFVGSVAEPALTALLLGKAAAGSRARHRLPDRRGRRLAPGRDARARRRDDRRQPHRQRLRRGHPGVRRASRRGRRHASRATTSCSSVVDSGPGLPPDAVDEAFRRGFSTKEQGSAGRRGIGLALVAQSVARLGGEMEVVRSARRPVHGAAAGGGEDHA